MIMHNGAPPKRVLPCGFFVAIYAIRSVSYKHLLLLSVGVAWYNWTMLSAGRCPLRMGEAEARRLMAAEGHAANSTQISNDLSAQL
jgi:hypothetical protein